MRQSRNKKERHKYGILSLTLLQMYRIFFKQLLFFPNNVLHIFQRTLVFLQVRDLLLARRSQRLRRTLNHPFLVRYGELGFYQSNAIYDKLSSSSHLCGFY